MYWSCKAFSYVVYLVNHNSLTCIWYPVLLVYECYCSWPAQHPFLSHHQTSYSNSIPFGQSGDKGMDTWLRSGPPFTYLGLFWCRWGHSPIPLWLQDWEPPETTFCNQAVTFILRQWSQNPERQRPLPALPGHSRACSCESIKNTHCFWSKRILMNAWCIGLHLLLFLAMISHLPKLRLGNDASFI